MTGHEYIKYGFNKEIYTALEAITEAQKIAFAPILFQAIICLKNKGILFYIDQSGKTGINLEELTKKVSLSSYAIELLLDVALSLRIIYKQDSNYILGKVGHFLLHDKMTEVNLNFSQDICYQSMFFLQEALEKGEPSGLKVFGDGNTIYPMLQSLPEQAKKSWFDFDHFYSDHSFPVALPHIMELKPKHIYDIGGNTGKWAIYSAKHLPETQITILDLPEQIAVAKENIKQANLENRIDGIAVNLLETDILSNHADLWWMSQFLDCFSTEQIVHILKLINRNMHDDAYVCIMDLFWDRQNFAAGALSLNASSLYFSCLANGNSRFYHSKVFYQCLNEAGFHVEKDIDGLGFGHSLLICKKR